MNNQLQFNLLFLQDYPEYDTFIFSNIQSLHKYFELIKADLCFNFAKFIILVETWTVSSDNYEFENYTCVYRHCPGVQRRLHGIFVHVLVYDSSKEKEKMDRTLEPIEETIRWKVENFGRIVLALNDTYEEMVKLTNEKFKSDREENIVRAWKIVELTRI